MKEKIINTKQCKSCNIEFNITDKDVEFYEKISPVFNWIRHSIASPTLCPDCRSQRRFSFRNERNLFPRKHPNQRHLERIFLKNKREIYDKKCNKCNLEIETAYNPKDNNIVYCEKCYLKSVY